jgi:hypothetical protein
MVREILAQREVEKLAAQIDRRGELSKPRPPQSWFDDEDDNPFEPEKDPSAVGPLAAGGRRFFPGGDR